MTILNETHVGGTGKPPSERRDWDVQAAFTRLAGADVDGFRKAISERAAQYCTEQDQHLSFEEVQAAVADGDIPSLAADRQHFQECSFCQELRDAITPHETTVARLTSSPASRLASRHGIPTALCMSDLTNSRLGGFLFH